jgi:hypothetical protein
MPTWNPVRVGAPKCRKSPGAACAWTLAADSHARIGRSARLGEYELAVKMQRVFGVLIPYQMTGKAYRDRQQG